MVYTQHDHLVLPISIIAGFHTSSFPLRLKNAFIYHLKTTLHIMITFGSL